MHVHIPQQHWTLITSPNFVCSEKKKNWHGIGVFSDRLDHTFAHNNWVKGLKISFIWSDEIMIFSNIFTIGYCKSVSRFHTLIKIFGMCLCLLVSWFVCLSQLQFWIIIFSYPRRIYARNSCIEFYDSKNLEGFPQKQCIHWH